MILACVMGSMTVGSFAHTPFVAPSSYVVQGGHSAILAGFSEQPFDSEVAIKGFDFKVIYPDGEDQALTLIASKALSIADIDTVQTGTYQMLGQRVGELKYAKLGERWLRILDAEASHVPALAARNFAIPTEVTAKDPQISVQRFDQVLSYFSKKQPSSLSTSIEQGMQVGFSTHPNQISLQQPLSLQLKLNNKPAAGFQILLEKQATVLGESIQKQQVETNAMGEVVLPWTAAGQYRVTISSPEAKVGQKPNSVAYRTILSLWVNP